MLTCFAPLAWVVEHSEMRKERCSDRWGALCQQLLGFAFVCVCITCSEILRLTPTCISCGTRIGMFLRATKSRKRLIL